MAGRRVILVTQDPWGYTSVRWHTDIDQWAVGEHDAYATARELWVSGEADHDVKRQACALFQNELAADSKADLSFLATHRQPGQGEEPEPIPGREAA